MKRLRAPAAALPRQGIFFLALGLLLAATTLPAPDARAAGDRLLFWEVALPDATVYLLGSMHLASADVYPLRPEIMQAWERADSLVVELDITGPRALEIQVAMLERGRYPAGRTLQDDLSPETWRRLSDRLEANGLPAPMMQALKPGLVVTTLSTLELVKLGLDPEQGIDRYFLALARGNKPVLELETVERQLDVLLDVPEPELLVAQTLGQLDELDTIMQRLIDRWKAGDGPALAKLVIEDELAAHPEYATLHKRMFDDRNREMTERIMALQGAGDTLFVVVGAGHLVGERGIIALLTRRGYAPRQR
ncbi:MAG: TraB/GumN family protein [Halieaceae bacterium]|jgi:uncharacterized protein YbaP (TraB family)|nr:TraB/GumN family protein [Halieaceae bacterium]